ncbi:zinc finger protein 69 homolog B-like [Malaya genurostris]|uniref:zinc finger protein 69 homolog B-like n=1 Tax=Malaya genurostris TaxID=325434 RepID=UPI0026F39C8A|nr:zinc finger protein 69 homolog B-like [Malaya genurostris]
MIMDNLNQPMNIAEYNSLITNIIESAVDELILKRDTAGVTLRYDVDDATGQGCLLFHICKLCAKEESMLLDISEQHLALINELTIGGIEASSGCTKICTSCVEFLGRIRDFRYRCEEAQKRISSLLAERRVISDFLNLDFTRSEEEPYGGFRSPIHSSVKTVEPEQDYSVVNDSSSETKESEQNIKPVQRNAKPREVKKQPTVNKKVEPKKSKKRADSRRRIVDGKLQWVCLDCEQVFGSCVKLKKHRQTCDLVGTVNSKRLGSFNCEICGQSLPSLMGLRVHRHKHNKIPQDSAPKSIGQCKPKILNTKISTPPKRAVCDVCGKAFNGRSALRSHMVFHDEDKRLECRICKKKFFKMYRLKDHMNSHSNVRGYNCQICGKAFFTKEILYKHTRSHDVNFRKYPCSICPMRFPHPYKLRSHMMVHTSELPHGCKICTSKFRFSWDLKKHYVTAHPPPSADVEEPDELLSELPPPLDEMIPDSLLHPSSLPLVPLSPLAPPSPLCLPDPPRRVVDLIEEEPHDDLSVMLADIPPHQQPELTPSVAAVQPVLAEHPFDTENLLEDASRDFATDCFATGHLSGEHTTDGDDFYCFMEC